MTPCHYCGRDTESRSGGTGNVDADGRPWCGCVRDGVVYVEGVGWLATPPRTLIVPYIDMDRRPSAEDIQWAKSVIAERNPDEQTP